jgi:dolichol-phosphate mannosyltransferase
MAMSIAKMIDSGTHPALRLETRMKDRGLTNSIWRGIELATGKIIVWLDCDLSMPTQKIPELLQVIDDGYDIAIGSRFIKGGQTKKNLSDTPESPLAVALSVLLNYISRILLFWNFTDYTSGFIAIKKDIFNRIKLSGDYGEYFMDLITKAILLDYKFKEIPYIVKPRIHGESKTGSTLPLLIQRGIKYLAALIKLFLLKVIFRLGFKKLVSNR